ncbi:hypothetical protein EGM51_09835 [Verrucomicrobia bacterium S94]|nr:hypothetical protein EGM51_09835 [Verrucomicrobia bacterium S94]
MSDGDRVKPDEEQVVIANENFSRKGLVTSPSNGPRNPPAAFLSGSGKPVDPPPTPPKKDD